MSDAYDFRPGGSLKLKGVKDGGVVKKKKKSKSSSSKTDSIDKEREQAKELLLQEDVDVPSPSGSGRNSPAVQSKKDNKTDAERRFEEIKRRRLADRVAKLAHKTHKERVQEFNAHLESLSEHHDIPKVGPG